MQVIIERGDYAEAVYPVETSDILQLTLSTDTNIYASGDVLADTQELANASRQVGGKLSIRSVVVYDKGLQSQPFDLVFFRSNVALGTENATPSITAANAKEIMGVVPILANDYIDFGLSHVAHVPVSNEILIKTASDSRSIYIGAMSRGAGTYAADDLTITIGIVRL